MAATERNKAGVRELRADRQAQVFALRKSGATIDQIATALHIPRSTAFKDVKDVLIKLRKEQLTDAAEWRTLELQQIDQAMMAISKQVKAGHLGAIDRWLRLMQRRANLLGYDAQPDSALAIPANIFIQAVPARGKTEPEPFQGEEE